MEQNENLEEILKDPLAIFDWINKKAWKDPTDSEVSALISKTRADIEAEPNRSQQYLLIAGYMAILKQKATGKTNALDLLQRTIVRRYISYDKYN